ncbi:hypothetical protein A3726_21370 [Erythrobacter sp. HI0037]|nr:hypothetical protein A3719_13410 [Erythrobacter sp. HI0020]KZY13415.1 hypothetical protein A3726_21370 [Erythrobacter sp. HI0037]
MPDQTYVNTLLPSSKGLSHQIAVSKRRADRHQVQRNRTQSCRFSLKQSARFSQSPSHLRMFDLKQYLLMATCQVFSNLHRIRDVSDIFSTPHNHPRSTLGAAHAK